MAMAELENTGEEAAAGKPDREALQNAEARMGLHDPHHPENRGAGHETVGVEHHGEIIVLAMMLAEIMHVAALEADIAVAAAIDMCGFCEFVFLNICVVDAGGECDARVGEHQNGIYLDLDAHQLAPADGAEEIFMNQDTLCSEQIV